MQSHTIGRYRIREELGRGAMGVVFLADDSVIGRAVAIKTIRLDTFTDAGEREKLKERLLREARSAGLLSHPNIVTVYDVGEERGVAFIAMEYVAGRTVDQLLRAQGMVLREQVLGVLTQVAGALDYAHASGVVHRDIKPGNLMLAADGSARITDFGVAKLLSHQATQTDMMLGTPNYMAPEQIDARGVDGRTDQFALSVIAYELLTGERPFHAEVLSTLLFRILREEPAAPHLLNATLNERVSAVIARGLAKRPDDRFGNCTAFTTALAVALAGCGEWAPLARASAGTAATVMSAASPQAPMNDETVVGAAAVAVDAPAFTRVGGQRSGGGRRLLLGALAATLAIAAGVYWWMNFSQPAPIVVAAPATETAVVDETRPSPLSEAVVPSTPVAETTETAAPAPPPAPSAPTPVPAAVTKPAGPISGIVELSSTPQGATVRIDDTRDQCTTPCSMELSQGRHLLHYTLPGHRDAQIAVTVPLEARATMRMDPLTGTLMVYSTPPGAMILLNGLAQKGVTPSTLRLAPGKYKLTLRQDGKQDHTREVEVRDQAIAQVEFSWQ